VKHVFHLWTMPLLLATLTVFGLLAALLGTGIWQPLAWIAIAVPVAVPLVILLRVTARRLRR
jgi:hypothetical protein